MSKWGNGIAVGVMMLACARPASAVTDAEKCEAAKLKRAGKYSYCRLKAEAKAVETGGPVNYLRCDFNYGQKWVRAEEHGGGMCPTNGDRIDLQDRITADTDFIALKLAGVRFVDNGDGTVTDLETDLTWEKKNNLGNIHDVDNVYTWCIDVAPADQICDDGGAPDGTAFTIFLATLNNSTSEDGMGEGGCFAGHCDWRLPTVAELQTILLAPFPCGTFPCIDPAFGFTVDDEHWSSTTISSTPSPSAWSVNFHAGNVGFGSKTKLFAVRAVRTGP